MIVFGSEIGLMKCTGEGMGDSLSVCSRPWSCIPVRGRRLGNGQRSSENMKCMYIGYRMCNYRVILFYYTLCTLCQSYLCQAR